MRAPFQILALPYRMVDGAPYYCVFHRADHDQWQFVAGGGEDAETPLDNWKSLLQIVVKNLRDSMDA